MDSSNDWVVVKTTLPIFPASADRPIISVERLLIRVLRPEDVDGLHILRTQPEVMKWTAVGRVDVDMAETAKTLAMFLPPNDKTTFNCGIFSKEDGTLIGVGGCNIFLGEMYGWPEIGYMFRKEYHGKGLATEFVRAFMEAWNGLPREEVEIKVKRESLPEQLVRDGLAVVEEQTMAVTETLNLASQTILTKCGFEHFLECEKDEFHDPPRKIRLIIYRYFPGRISKA